MSSVRCRSLCNTALASVLFAVPLASQAVTTTPESFFGHEIGADYVLPNYEEFTAFVRQLDTESDRMTLVDIGQTAEGRTQLMAIITSPENHANLEHYREISERLAKAEGLTDEEARQLAQEGKAVVWFDGGLHATEVLGAQQLTETIYQLVSRTDEETMRILDDVIVLATHANPDGMELVSNWYMRESDPMERSTGGIPRLYQKYIGHDNNRDFYASTQAETENINRQMYHVWFPQIMYNHHQTGPEGTVMFAPPFRDPFNYFLDPLLVTEIDLVGAAMHSRFEAENKPGVTMRRGANYSTWWNGGLRTTAYFHNMVGLLTETIGNPTPIEIPFVPERQLPSGDLPLPIAPQTWHFRQSVDYSVTANYAVFDVAQRYRETFLYNIYRMGMNAIEKGSRDTWTVLPSAIDEVRATMEAELGGSLTSNGDGPDRGGDEPNAEQSQRFYAMLQRPEDRDPRGYILPSDQADFPTVVEFINTLRENGITVHRATESFTAGGKTYPAGSIIVKSAQAFRPHLLDMFEAQDHPNDFAYPGGPPIPPYDAAGWTLAFQMGVEFDRILEEFDGPFQEVTDWNLERPAGTVASEADPAGYLLSPAYVDGYGAMYGLVSEGEEVYRLKEPFQAAGETFEPGTYYVPASDGTRAKLEQVAADLGLSFAATETAPTGTHTRLGAPRIALWDRYGGSMPSGWTRWLLEQNEIPFDVVYAPQLDAGDLSSQYDAIIFVDGAIPAPSFDGQEGDRRGGGRPSPESIPEEYRNQLGDVTAETTIPALKTFLEEGGTVITIGSSTALAEHLGLPIGNRLVDESGEELPDNDFYIPGSVLQIRVDQSDPIAYGMNEYADVFFDHSPAFSLGEGAQAQGIRQIGWYDSPEPLRSGWAWGQENLEDGAAAIAAPVGDGTLLLFGPEILYRAQPRGTFKSFFNSLSLSAAEEAAI
ncbi:MAG: peptidase [Gemmatimonas sp.]|nr:peptidase [Gemmatimonas sp.]